MTQIFFFDLFYYYYHLSMSSFAVFCFVLLLAFLMERVETVRWKEKRGREREKEKREVEREMGKREC